MTLSSGASRAQRPEPLFEACGAEHAFEQPGNRPMGLDLRTQRREAVRACPAGQLRNARVDDGERPLLQRAGSVGRDRLEGVGQHRLQTRAKHRLHRALPAPGDSHQLREPWRIRKPPWHRASRRALPRRRALPVAARRATRAGRGAGRELPAYREAPSPRPGPLHAAPAPHRARETAPPRPPPAPAPSPRAGGGSARSRVQANRDRSRQIRLQASAPASRSR